MKLTGKSCLVIGGGKIALHKVRELLQCGAQVTVISPGVIPEMMKLIEKKKLNYQVANFEQGDTNSFFLVIAATNDALVNKLIADECETQQILYNVVDAPDQCNYFTPAVVHQGDLKIAISTNGKSPMLAKRIREELEQNYTKEYALFIRYLGFLRLVIKREYPDVIEQRKQLLERLIESNVLEMLKSGERKKFKEEIKQIIESFSFKLLTAEVQRHGEK